MEDPGDLTLAACSSVGGPGGHKLFCRNWCYCTTPLSARNGGVKKQPTVLSLIPLVQGWLQVQTRQAEG